MLDSPLISVCIGAYNREAFIGACLNSVFAQTYTNIEVVVVDDASTDGTVDVVRKYGDRVKLIQRNENSRCADIPRAEAVAAASGEWCALLDSDDVWHPEKLSRQVVVLQQHPDWMMCHTYANVKDEFTQEEYIRHENVIPTGPSIAAELLAHCFICTSTVMVRKDVWLAAVHEVKPNTFGTEWDIFIAIARKHHIGFISDPLVTYRRAGTGISHKNWKRVGHDLPGLDRIYRKELWRGVVTKQKMRRIWAVAAIEGSMFWRERRMHGRALWFLCQGLRRTAWSGGLLLELSKVVAGALVPRKQALR